MVHCKLNYLYNFSPVAAISNRVYSGAIGNRGYEIVKFFSSVLNHALSFVAYTAVCTGCLCRKFPDTP